MTLFTRGVSRLLGLPPAKHRRLVREHDVPCPLDDGTVLLADRWYPAGHERGLPTLLMRTPYGRSGLMAGEAAVLAERGYNVLVQSVRGTHGSGGTFTPFVHERADGPQVLAWVHEQPWCDGRVATWGSSYCGYTQLAMADGADPALVSAMSPSVASADLRGLFRPYGAFALASMGGWVYGLDPEGRRNLLATFRHMRAGKGPRERAYQALPVREDDVVLTGGERHYFRDWVDSPVDAPYWDQFDARAGHHAQKAPMSFHAGWFDIFTPYQLADAEELLRTGRDVRLTVGPWNHGGGFGMRLRDALQLFDETMKDGPSRRDGRPVRVQLYNDKRWWALPTWPAPADMVAWHLRPDHTLALEAGDSDARLDWADDPRDPAPSPGGAALDRGGPADNAAREARDDVLVFTTPPFTQETAVLGTPRARLRVDADVPSYDVVVRLCVVDAKGVSRNVSDGLQRLPEGAGETDIAMWPVGLRVHPGERLRLQVAGSLHPLWARNLHTHENPATGTTTAVAHQSVLVGPSHLSRLELPVVSLSSADLAADQNP